MSSKVYDKPDINISRIWEMENSSYLWIAFRNGKATPFSDVSVGDPHKITNGRWRPYQPNNPEPWPPRKLMPRRCWATWNGERQLYVWIPGVPGQNTFLAVSPKSSECWWKGEGELSNITFIDPEQEAVEVTQ